MYGQLGVLYTTLEFSHISFLAPFTIIRSILGFLMNVIRYRFVWLLKFGVLLAVHPFLNYCILIQPVLSLLSLYLLTLLVFFHPPLLTLLSLSLFLNSFLNSL